MENNILGPDMNERATSVRREVAETIGNITLTDELPENSRIRIVGKDATCAEVGALDIAGGYFDF